MHTVYSLQACRRDRASSRPDVEPGARQKTDVKILPWLNLGKQARWAVLTKNRRSLWLYLPLSSVPGASGNGTSAAEPWFDFKRQHLCETWKRVLLGYAILCMHDMRIQRILLASCGIILFFVCICDFRLFNFVESSEKMKRNELSIFL